MMMMKKKNKNKVICMSTIEQDHHLSEDLILEILSYLPPITLVRFKSLSKTWYSLISNPDFCRRNTANYQLHRSDRHHCGDHIDDDHYHNMLEEPSPPGILLNRRFRFRDSNIVIYPHSGGLDHEQKKLALLLQNLNDYRPAVLNEPSTAPAKKESFKLADCCNGLLLYVHKIFTRKEEDVHIKFTRKEEKMKEIVCSTIYVCNPITKNYIKLPTIDDIIVVDIDNEQKLDKNSIAQIVFNPSLSLTYKVFIWIPFVKRSTSRLDSSHYYRRLYVYSSEARSWRLSVSIPRKEFPLFFICDYKAVLWNGVLHWTSFAGGSTDDVLPLCYDIAKETVWKMKFPKMATGYTHRRLLYFGLCGERLLMIEKQYKEDDGWLASLVSPSSFDVWEKQEQNGDEYGDMWTVRYRVNFEEVDNDFYSKVIGSKLSVFDASILDIYRSMRTKNEEVVEEEEVMLMKVGSVSNRNHRIIFFNLTSNTFGNEKLRNRKSTVLPNIGILSYADILRYNVTLFPP